jgi:putative oxidoreductase
MSDTPSSAVPLIGRIFMSSVFLIFGVLKFVTLPYYVQLAAGKGMPMPQAAILCAAALEVLGGLAILVGFQTRIVSWILFVYMIPTSILFHNYWALQGALRAAMQAHFFKNMAIMGGLLFLAHWGAGAYSIDASRKSAN